ncbi:MAG: glycosyltransferase family 39 protein, partial [Oscillospiraceae bacterium]|nr:glycosyltransferase family 39 protein [Oscillospiraceae bacterium]
LQYYTGLNTGSYTLETLGEDGQWHSAGSLEQSYAALFRWCEFTPEEPITTDALRISSATPLYLGELALYDGSGALIDAGKITCPQAELFDEQAVLPAKYTYLNGSYFDEIYHVRTAQEHIQSMAPYEISHPPLGKIILGLGIRMFGLTPFGWRFMGTLFGVGMLPGLYILIKKLFGGKMVPVCGTLVFAFDFMHFAQTRIATIDTYGVFFIIYMYLFLWLFICSTEELRPSRRRMVWLGLSGLCFGLGCASKWICVYAGAGLAVLWLAYWVRMLAKHWKKAQRALVLRSLAVNILWCLVFFVLVPALVYYLSYVPYGKAQGMHGIGMLLSKDYARIVLANQQSMFNYHAGIVATHPYSSRWYQWLLDLRPILYYLDYGSSTKSVIGAFTSPLLTWAGLIAVLFLPMPLLYERDDRAGFIFVGFWAQLLPWVLISRLTFAYHYFPSTVFLTLAVCLVFSRLEQHHPKGQLLIGSFTSLSLGLFVMFYPLISGASVGIRFSAAVLKWLPSWPF